MSLAGRAEFDVRIHSPRSLGRASTSSFIRQRTSRGTKPLNVVLEHNLATGIQQLGGEIEKRAARRGKHGRHRLTDAVEIKRLRRHRLIHSWQRHFRSGSSCRGHEQGHQGLSGQIRTKSARGRRHGSPNPASRDVPPAATLTTIGRTLPLKLRQTRNLTHAGNLIQLMLSLMGTVAGILLIVGGVWFFDRLTPLDYRSEVRKGNVAAGLVVGSVVLGVTAVVVTVILI